MDVHGDFLLKSSIWKGEKNNLMVGKADNHYMSHESDQG